MNLDRDSMMHVYLPLTANVDLSGATVEIQFDGGPWVPMVWDGDATGADPSWQRTGRADLAGPGITDAGSAIALTEGDHEWKWRVTGAGTEIIAEHGGIVSVS